MLVNAQGESLPKVLIAVPCGTEVKADFARDLALLVGYTTYVRPNMELPLFFVKGTYLPRARAALVDEALTRGCTHILWLDSDMRFPKDTLVHLLGHEKPVVAANYPTRQAPILPTALDMEGVPVFQGEGLTPVRTCGMGVMLTATEVFQKIGKPYFALGYNKQADDYAGEDTYFCEMARRAGYEVLIDHALSEVVSHHGEFAYQMPHARMTLEAAQAAGAIRGPDDVH